MSKTFSSETFQKTFEAYVRKWHISEAVLFILAFLPFFDVRCSEIFGTCRNRNYAIFKRPNFRSNRIWYRLFWGGLFWVCFDWCCFLWFHSDWQRILRVHSDWRNIRGDFCFRKCLRCWTYRHFYRFNRGNSASRWHCFWAYRYRSAGKWSIRAFL